MLFNSAPFIFLFLPLVLMGWWSLRGDRTRLAFLTIASYIFYVFFDFPTGLKLLPLLIGSTMVDYVAGHLIHASTNPRSRKALLIVSLSVNLGVLGFFKYLGFFEQVLDGVAGLFGHAGTVPIQHLILPLGISFYTFNSMSYTIDIYRGVVRPARSVFHYSAFVSLFPHLVAGPIVRFRDLDLQLQNLPQRLASSEAFTGLAFFSVGLIKKLLIADALLAPTVDRLFGQSADLEVVNALVAIMGYSIQLFFDFSAYSEMAVGLAMLLGLHFPQNFNSPFKAVSMADFWRRWHMTLGHWVRDYLFVPLGGSHGSLAVACRTSFITMFVVGLWHGAAWTYVCFGVGHALAMVAHTIARRRGRKPWSTVTGRLNTLVIWTGLAVFIKAPTMAVAMNVLTAAVGRNGLGLDALSYHSKAGVDVPLSFGVLLAILFILLNTAPNIYEILSRPARLPRLRAATLGAAGAVGVLLLQAPSPFLYFQF